MAYLGYLAQFGEPAATPPKAAGGGGGSANTALQTPSAHSALGQVSRSDLIRAVRERLAALSLSPGLRRAIQLSQERSTAGKFAGFSEGDESWRRKKDAMILALKIPESPYSDQLFAEKLHKVFSVIEGVHAVATIFSLEVPLYLGVSSVAAYLGVGVAIAAPFAAFLGVMLSLGGPYAAARAKIARERVLFGFALGVVMGADERHWKYAKRLFWEWVPEVNTWDQDAGKIAQKAFNVGLASGFIQGRKLSEKQRAFFWGSVRTTLTQGDRTYYSGDPKSWPERLWVDWYIRAAASFIKLYVKD